MQAVTDNNGDTGARGESMQMFTDQEAGPLTMSKVSIKKNFILNLLLRVTRVTIPLITFPYVSRILQPEGLGRVTFAESFIAYLILIAQLGVPTYGIRACARVRDDREKLSRTVHELVAINLLMSLLAYAILIICMMKVPRIGNDREIFVIFSINIVMGAVGMDWMYEGLEQYSYITVRTLTLRLVSVILIFLLIHRPEQAPLYAGIVVFSVSGPQLVNLIHARKYIALRPVGRYHLSPHMKAALIFFLMAGITAVYTSLDKVMLGFIAGDAPVGYYSVAVKVKNVLFLCISALAAVLLPRSSYYVGTGRMEAQRKLSNKALNYVFIVSLSLALFFFLYTEESVLFLSGKNYVPAVLPMKIIMPGVGLIGLTNVFTTQVLIPIGKEKQVLSANVAGAVIDVLLNLMDRCKAINLFGFHQDAMNLFLSGGGKMDAYIHHGYSCTIHSVDEYYKAQMDMLDGDIRHQIFPPERPVRTKIHEEVSTYYGEQSVSRNSLVADNCRIEGEIENCIVGSGARIAPGAKVKNCVLMRGCTVEAGAQLSNVIVDKHCSFSEDSVLTGSPKLPMVVPKYTKI